ncbi:MAG TPA: RidA family protein [Chloroflexota bacterium]|nr:RidA family protein [Chloroflexota bacterium]
MATGKKLIPGPDGKTLRGGNCHGVSAGGFIFLSAVRGTLPDSRELPRDAEAQARQLFENIKSTLHWAGAGMEDVVKVAVYMVDLQGDRPPFNKVWQEYFGDEPPARFAVQVTDLGNTGDGSKFLADVTALAP